MATNYTQQLQDWLSKLSEPVDAGQVGLSEQERRAIYGLGRGQIQGATRTSAEAMKELMGGKGFRAGESGIADTPIAQILRSGQQNLAGYSTNLAVQEAMNRFNQRFQLEQLGTQRTLGGAGILGGLRGAEIGKEATLGAAGISAGAQRGIAGERLAWDKERFKEYTFPWEQEQGTWGNLMQMYGMQQGSQQQRYAPWYQSMIGAYNQ